MNQKGQAAVTDALYFVLIVTSLSIFLFGFANSYGSSVREQITNEYNTTFATNALKAILYSSTPRDVSQSLGQPDAEIDYLLAVVKEDYADDQLLNERERKVLGKAISKVLSPIQDSTDYAFYIAIPSEKKFVFAYLHLTEFDKVPYSASFKQLGPGGKGRFYVYSAKKDDKATAKDESHRNYFCAIGGEADFDVLNTKIARLISNVGPTSQASSSVKLTKVVKRGDVENFKAQADLVLWDALWLGATDERLSELFTASSWNCIPADDEGQQNNPAP